MQTPHTLKPRAVLMVHLRGKTRCSSLDIGNVTCSAEVGGTTDLKVCCEIFPIVDNILGSRSYRNDLRERF